MIVRFSKPLASAVAGLGVAVFALSVAACSDDEPTGPGPQLAKFCQDLFASSAFSCCTEADRDDAQFSIRYRYADAANCEAKLNAIVSATAGHTVFDGEAASSCISHLSSRTCGVLPTSAVRAAEDDAGCNRILVGTQQENQACGTNDECIPGLVCPPPKATGGSTCVKPAALNQACTGPSTTQDHPPCEDGLVCELIDSTDNCPAPPCLNYQCVGFKEAGEECFGLECGRGLSCRDGICNSGGAGSEGQKCRILEHCVEGLYCDSTTGTCASRKASGQACDPAANPTYECQGVCKPDSESGGTCEAFCGSG